ncbi:MAG: hypothetical protein PF689_01405 [Deltaproteobacteria bacterium]|jgi:hypothetical protein|nr:hypothetical protein [Deltaproteobacteria bacterium]
MKNLILILAFVSLVFAACEDEESNNNTNNINNVNNVNNINNTNDWEVVLSDTGCKMGGVKALSDYSLSGFECIYYNYDGTDLTLVHVNRVLNCCPDEALGITGTVDASGQNLLIDSTDNGGLCDCMCPYDVTYEIADFTSGSYYLGASSLNPSELIDFTEPVEGIHCEDRLGDFWYVGAEGERGHFCQDNSECMNGDGYCLDVDGDKVCVNSCTITEECPVPALETCDTSGDLGYCAPDSL